jgi:hypothetical protein
MPGSGKALRRLEAFYAERAMGGPEPGEVAFVAPMSPAEARLEALRAYREARARPGPSAGFAADASAGGRNWSPLGPFAVRRGQAVNRPLVSGRVRGIAVSKDGNRIYVASANGGVWRSLDSGRTWRPMSDEEEQLEGPNPPPPPVPPATPPWQVDSLACGAIALVDGGGVDTDVLYVGTGEATALLGVPARGYFGVGMIRSTDGGRTWTREADDGPLFGQAVHALAVHPDAATDPNAAGVVVAATTAGLFRRRSVTNDWVRVTNPPVVNHSATPHPPAAVSVFTSVTVTKIGADTVWVAITGDGQAVRSLNTVDWVPLVPQTGHPNVATALPGALTLRVSLGCAGPGPGAAIVYALACRANGDIQGLHRIDLSAGSPRWRLVTGFPAKLFGDAAANPPIGFQGDYDQAIAVDPNNPGRVYLGGSTVMVAGTFNGAATSEYSGSIFRCQVTGNAAGTSFTCAHQLIGGSVHGDIHVLTFRPASSNELWTGCDGGVFAARDASSGSTDAFESRNTGLCTLTLSGLDHHPEQEAYVFCGAQDNGGLRWLGGDVWDHQLPGDGGATVVNRATKLNIINGYVHEDLRRAAIGADIDANRYQADDVKPPGASGTNTLFYPPIASDPTSALVVFGGHRPYATEDFATHWSTLPAPRRSATVATNPIPAGGLIRSVLVVSPTLFYAGWDTGHVTRYTRPAGPPFGAWRGIDLQVPGDANWPGDAVARERRPVTGIALDRRDMLGNSIFITLGGEPGHGPRIRHLDSTGWHAITGTAPALLLDIQHNAIVDDPFTIGTLYAAADFGVWETTDSGVNWAPLEGNLPDAAVLDLDLLSIPVPGVASRLRLLRASTHGRGVFEMRLDRIQPAVELMVRATVVDRRHRPEAQVGAVLTGSPAALDECPDIFVEPPSPDGHYRLPGDVAPLVTELIELPRQDTILATDDPNTPAVTRVHVVVRNRGWRTVDDVRVSLMVGPATADLPPSFRDFARGGVLGPDPGWRAVGSTMVHDLVNSRPGVATFAMSSDVLPSFAAAHGQTFRLLALVHHASDPFPDDPTTSTADPNELVKKSRFTALRRVTVTNGELRAAPVGGTGLIAPLATTLLAHERLASLITGLQAKVTAAKANPAATVPHPVERRVLAMAKAAQTRLEAGPHPAVPDTQQGHEVGSFALLGSLGFELPRYSSAFLPGGTWVADTLRRGTADPHMSLVTVPASELPLAIAAAAASAPTREAIHGFASGMLSGAAANVVLGPQLAGLLAQETHADWSPARSSRGSRALEHHLRERYLGGVASPVARWLPPPDQVPVGLWEPYIGAIQSTFRLPDHRTTGFGSFEHDFQAGTWLTPDRMGAGYGLLLDDARSANWGFWPWFGLVLPIFTMPAIAFAAARGLPHARSFVDGGPAGERAVFEGLTLSMGLGALAPFTYSMLMWPKVQDRTEVFATALVMGLARLGITIAALASSGDEEQSAGVRWGGFFPPLAAADAYAAVRAAIGSDARPGVAKVFGLQTVPAITGLTTLGLLGIARAATGSDPVTEEDRGDRDLAYGLITGISGAAGVVGAVLTALALRNGAGWQTWFRHDIGGLPLLAATAHTGVTPLNPNTTARVFAGDTLWVPPSTTNDVDHQRYPAGARPVVRLWWEGDGELRLKVGESNFTFRHGDEEHVLELPANPTATEIAAKLQADLPRLKAEGIGADDPTVPLPLPRSLSDAGDAAPFEAAEALSSGFRRVPTTQSNALVVHQSPRVEQSAAGGRTATDAAAYQLVPATGLPDADTGIGDAADLASLLLVAASPSFAPASAPLLVEDLLDPLPTPAITPVMQVFRRWNLDERRLDEWRSLVTGHGATVPPEEPKRGDVYLHVREQRATYHPQTDGRALAEAMGWLPLWRAWLSIATSTAENAGSNAPAPASRPTVAVPGGPPKRPTNLELTNGVRYLLDMGAT